MKPKNTICLWFDKDAQDAARFYAATFPNSEVTAVHKAPGDYPSGKAGDVLTVEFKVLGIPCLGLNGGPAFKHNEAFSFQIATDDQAETDRYWNAIVGNGGAESACGWCKDKWGLSWQITPRVLMEAMTDSDRAAAMRVRNHGSLRNQPTSMNATAMMNSWPKSTPKLNPSSATMKSCFGNGMPLRLLAKPNPCTSPKPNTTASRLGPR